MSKAYPPLHMKVNMFQYRKPVYIIRKDDDANGLHYSGESQVINARGEVISKAEPYQEAVLHCTLDYEKLQRFREKFPLGPDWDGFNINI